MEQHCLLDFQRCLVRNNFFGHQHGLDESRNILFQAIADSEVDGTVF
jgi:hypothetical protein